MEITPQEIISTVQTFPVSVQEESVETLQKNLKKTISSAPDEDEIEQILLARGPISEIPPRVADNEEETYTPIEVAGKPLSKTILEEARINACAFFDSSSLVKRYSRETGTNWVFSLVRSSARNRLYLARITGVEVIAALTKRRRVGSLTRSLKFCVSAGVLTAGSRRKFAGIFPDFG